MKGESSKQEADHYIVATPSALVISFGEELHRQARACLERNGKVTFSFKELAVTELPQTLFDDGVKVD